MTTYQNASTNYICRNGNQDCFCLECCHNEEDGGYCQCDLCIGLVENNHFDEEQKRKENFKKICDFFQLPSVYSTMEIKDFHNTDSILYYKFIEKNEINSDEITSLLKEYLSSIGSEDTGLTKKIKIMILVQIINLPNIRKFITAHNKLFDVISYKLKDFSKSNDRVFASFLEQFNFSV